MSLGLGSPLGHYDDVTTLFGEGGMGEVYRAGDTIGWLVQDDEDQDLDDSEDEGGEDDDDYPPPGWSD